MNKQQRLLGFYRVGLRLYPKNFREAYGAQVLMAAQDTLDATSTRAGMIRAVSRLAADLLVTALVENIHQMEEHMSKPSRRTSPSSAFHAALLGAQIVAIAAVSYVYLWGTFETLRTPRGVDTPLVTWYMSSVLPSLAFALVLGLTFALFRQVSWMSLWSKIIWSYSVWILGIVGLFIFGSAVDSIISLFYIPNGIPGVVGAAIGLGLEQILMMAVYLAGFYLLLRKFVKLLESSRSAVKAR